MNFEPIVEWLIYQEDDHRTPGKIVNLNDGAGFTRFGITSKNYGSLVPADFFTTMAFHPALEVAKGIYQNQQWKHINGDSIQSDEVAAVLLSAAVNLGIATAVKLVQRVLEVAEDGVLGMITTQELNSKDPKAVVDQFRGQWENHYREIVDHNPSDARFLAGWLARVDFPYPSSLVGNLYV